VKFKGLRRSSIAARLTRMNLMVSGMALLLAYFSFFSYDLVSSRQNLVQNLQTDAQITGSDTVSALLFDDAASARSTLAALSHSADIDYAALITNDGRTFAEYKRPAFAHPNLPRLATSQLEQTWERGRHVTVAERIIFQGKPEGSIYIVANLRELAARAARYLLIATLILAICLIVALVGSLKFRKVLARPVEELAETARAVAHKRDYSVRAKASSEHDELDVLTEAFNEMLSQIQQQEAKLRAAHDDLERRVEERTQELKAANSELESFSYTVAHDLRGPLEVIDGSMFQLQQSERGEEEAELIERSRRTVQSMALLINDLLRLSRATIASIKRESVNLSALAQEIQQELRLLEPWRKVQMKIVPNASCMEMLVFSAVC
jgi:signal transduction histidine kinase